MQIISNWSSILGFFLSLGLLILGFNVNKKIQLIKSEIWLKNNLSTFTKKLKSNYKNLNNLTDSEVWDGVNIRKELNLAKSNLEFIAKKISKTDTDLKSKIDEFTTEVILIIQDNENLDQNGIIDMIIKLQGMSNDFDNIETEINYR